MSWRMARSLTTLTTEVRGRYPGTTIWGIGDAAHRGRASDHNPNPAGVVTAIDVVGVEQARWLWNYLNDTRDIRVKYLIHAGRIVSTTVSPWVHRRYTGSNPHTDHVHVSVGRGPSGRTINAKLYDDSRPWIDLSPSKPVPAPAPEPESWLAMATEDELRTILREEIEQAFGGRSYSNDASRIRRSIRAIADAQGLETRHPVEPDYKVEA